jgi:hypothetical protein
METLAFFVAQQHPSTLAQVGEELRRQYWGAAAEGPDVPVDLAGSIEQGKALLALAWEQRRHYKVAILDVLMPQRETGPARQDFTLAKKLGSTDGCDAAVYTTTAEGEDFARLETEVTTAPDLPRRFCLLQQKGEGWANALYRCVAGVVHGDRIWEQFTRLFGQPSRSPVLGRVARSGRSALGHSQDVSLELASLKMDVGYHWPLLDVRLQQALETRFEVVPKEGSPIHDVYLR